MASSIISRIINTVEDKRLAMANGFAARKIALGSSWTTLRMIFRCEFTDSGAAPTGGAEYAWGFCSNKADLLTGNVGLAVMATNRTPAGALIAGTRTNYGTGKNVYLFDHYGVGGGLRVKSNAASSYYTSGNQRCQFNARAGAPTASRGLYWFEVRKAAPNWLVSLGGRTWMDTYDLDLTETQIQVQAEAGWAGVSGVNGHGYWGSDVNIGTPNEATYGSLDSIFFSWNRTTPAMEISDVYVTKID